MALSRFFVVIASYNNALWYESNLESLIRQDYPHWRAVYIDDASTDDTADLVERFVAAAGVGERFRLVRNEARRFPLANQYDAISGCSGDEVVVILDGDDRLANDKVLSFLNRIYQDPDVWLTYGSYVNASDGQRGQFCAQLPLTVIEHNRYRHYPWVSSHLRSFYGWLFQKIRVADLQQNGEFFKCAGDLAMSYPMLEIAGTHSRHVSDVLYVYNDVTPFNEYKLDFAMLRDTTFYIRGLPPYHPHSGGGSAGHPNK